jgi:hypothetical protein
MMERKFGFAVFAAVFVVAIATAGSHLAAQTDSRLEGTWVATQDVGEVGIAFSNGIVEIMMDGVVYTRGTCTSGDGKITMTITHLHGDAFEGLLESRLYSVEELRETMFGTVFGDDVLTSEVGYSINGNTLSISDNGETITYTRK